MRALLLSLLLIAALVPSADAGQGYCGYVRRDLSPADVRIVVGAGGAIGNCMCYMDPCVDLRVCSELYVSVGERILANETYDCAP